MYWADVLIQTLDKTTKHRVDDGSTPSGHYHVGSLRAIATHGLVYEAMKLAGFDVDFTYFFNDMDPMDGLPVYLDEKKYRPHMGEPMFKIPAPDGTSESFAAQYAQEYVDAINKLGFHPEIFWSSKLYTAGKMNEYVKKALDGVDEIRKIYLEVAKQKKPDNWYPLQVICPQCGKIGTTLVTAWDGKEVTFSCRKDLVKWAQGCGYEGTISPFDGRGKLMWKVDWSAMWGALGVTVEGAGKDHMSQGGSHDIAVQIAKRVFNVHVPFSFMNEFFLIGGAKMSSSKGLGFRAIDLLEILPGSVAKFLFIRTPYRSALNFDPSIPEIIPDLFDDYDECAAAWFESGEKSKQGRMFQAAQIEEVPKEKVFFPRFRTVAKMIQTSSVDTVSYFEKEKGSPLTTYEKKILEERIHYGKIWLAEFAPKDEVFDVQEELPESARNLSDEQKKFLIAVNQVLTEEAFDEGEKLQFELFELTKKQGIKTAAAFKALYQIFLGKNFGPKAGWFLLDLLKKDKEFVSKRLKEVIK